MAQCHIPPPNRESFIHRCCVSLEILPKGVKGKKVGEDSDDEGEGFFDRINEGRPRRSTYMAKTGIVSGENDPKQRTVRDPNFKYAQSAEQVSKEDYQSFMKRKDFSEFIDATSRLVERSLNQEFDLIGNFFVDTVDEEKQDD